jgi:tetratricopeptide (TPR) repeat protein
VVLQNFAAMKVTTGDLDSADAAFTEAALLDPQPNPICQQSLGVLHEYRGQLAEAMAIHAQYIAEHRSPFALVLLARAARRAGQRDTALRSAEQALIVARQGGDYCTEVYALALLAQLNVDAGDLEFAADVAEGAIKLAPDVCDPGARIASHAAVADVCLRSGEHHRASEHYRQALSRARHFRLRFDECEALIGLSHTEQAVGNAEHATRYHRAAVRLANDHGFRSLSEAALQRAYRLTSSS